MGVLAESLRSPCRTEEGLLEESSLYENCMRGSWGVLEESLWRPCGLHVNFKESGRASAILGLVLMDSLRTPEEVPVNSHITPWRLPGLDEDSLRTPWGLHGYVWLSVMTSLHHWSLFHLAAIVVWEVVVEEQEDNARKKTPFDQIGWMTNHNGHL